MVTSPNDCRSDSDGALTGSESGAVLGRVLPPSTPLAAALPDRWARLCPRLLPWALLLLVLVAYGRTLTAPFLFDDAVAVLRNDTIREIWSWRIFAPPVEGGTTTGRPLLNASFAINYAISGEAPWSYHLFNLLLHAANAALLGALVRRLACAPVLAERWASAAPWLGMITAVGWAAHPLQTESVSCVAQRSEVLCAFFYLLTLYCWLRYATAVVKGSRRRWWGFAVGACALGMASKEVMVTAPVVALLLDRTFVAGSFAVAWRARAGLWLALASTWVVLAVLVLGGGGARGASAGFGLGVTPWTYLLKQVEALTTYLWLVVWPHPLVLDYGTGVISDPAEVWGRGLLWLGLLGATGWALVRRPVLGLVGAWWFVILAPSSSVVPLVAQTMAEHRVYLPLAGLLACGAAGLMRLRRTGLLIAAAITVAWLATTVMRNGDYRDPLTIWASNVSAYPASARGHNNYALELERVGQPDAADREFAEALRLRPDYVAAQFGWGSARLARGQWAEAIPLLEAATERAPQHVDAWVNLGAALAQAGRPSAAEVALARAYALRPAPDVAVNLGILAEQDGDLAAARRHYEAALQLQPDFVPAASRLESLRRPAVDLGRERATGMAAAKAGRWEEAAAHFATVLAAEPDDADALANLGNVRLIQGRAAEAIGLYEQVLRLRPKDARTRQNLQIARRTADGAGP